MTPLLYYFNALKCEVVSIQGETDINCLPKYLHTIGRRQVTANILRGYRPLFLPMHLSWTVIFINYTYHKGNEIATSEPGDVKHLRCRTPAIT